MSSTPKRAPAGPTLEQLTAEVADLERQLQELRRLENATRNELARHKAAGDEEASAQARDDISRCRARTKELATQLEAARSKANGAAFEDYEGLFASQLVKLDAVETAIAGFAEAYTAAHKGLEAIELRMRQEAIPPDPLALRAKLEGITDRALYLATNGAVGRLRSFETPAELRARGAASLIQAGREWQAVTLRTIQHALRISSEETRP